ncbi:MAG: hypothetical protein ACOY3O_10800, partial [Thermodesulfobacteriota bacterium]
MAAYSLGYDGNGNLVRLADPLHQITRFGYDANSRLTYLTDARINTTQYTYDATGNNTARISPDLTRQTYVRDTTGELAGKTNRRGVPVSITRNPRGQITHIDYNDNSSVSYTYDTAGLLLAVEDATGITTLDYYPNHLLRRISSPGNRYLEYTYDAAGRRTSVTDQSGYRLDYAYTFDGELERIIENGARVLVRYTYDHRG